MKNRNVTIGTQLYYGFIIILVFVVLLGIVSFLQADQLHQQTEIMFEHPLSVRNSLSNLNTDIMNIRIAHRDLILAVEDEERQVYLQQMTLAFADAQLQFDNLAGSYLGPEADIRDAYDAYLLWKDDVEENNRLVMSGETETAIANLMPGSHIVKHRSDFFASFSKVDVFSLAKANELYLSSKEQKERLNSQLLLMIALILALSAAISYRIIRNIQKPLNLMNETINRFQQGDMHARVGYTYHNEFGTLSASINTLADQVEANTAMRDKTVGLADVMLREDDAHTFFRDLLITLMKYTNAQVASVYLLDSNQLSYEHFESIGMEGNAKKAFRAYDLEGEFGAAILSLKIQHLKNIPRNTNFTFHVTNGKYMPREIITIPISKGKQVTAILSLAAINAFEPHSMEWLHRNMGAMSARIEGILTYRRVRELMDQLEKQNRELDTQKSELSAQTVELMQQNSELEMQKKQLGEASRLKTHFLSNMSHELRTPLNSVIALSGVLSRRLQGLIPEEEFSYLEIIERNGKNLLLLINDVLDISRIEAGREEVVITQFQTDMLVNDVVSLLQPLAVQKNIDLNFESSVHELAIFSDMDKCRHILQNIIGNAIKFTDHGSVTITAQNNTDNLVLRVKDTGIGIPKEHLPYIFDEFRQADGSTSRKYGGTGLGLSIAKKYAELLGGTISVSSIPNEGSEFTIFLPIDCRGENKQADEEKIAESAQVQIPMIATSSCQSLKTILLVEDNESAIIQIKDFVQEMGHKVLVSNHADEALAHMGKTIPDAIILDLMMPDMDGFELLKMIRNAKTTAHVPVLILTAKHITKEELQVLKSNHIHQLIQKGDVDRIKLQRAISTMLYPAAASPANAKSSGPKASGKPLVLVIEDNQDNMITVKALLKNDYRVAEADNVLKGLEIAKTKLPDLVLMDIALSGMDGIEAFGHLRSEPSTKHIPVIALTASAMDDEREKIMSHGFDGFIAKPIDIKEFEAIMLEVLYGKQDS